MTGKIAKKKLVYGHKYNLNIVSILFIIVLLMLLQKPAEAKEPGFYLNIDNTSLEKGISTNLVLSVENAQGADIVEIQGLSNFNVLNQAHSSSTSIVNGDFSQKNKYTYAIMPVNEGEFALKGIVNYKGKRYETNQLDLTVKESNSINRGELENLFIKNIIDKKEIYFGEKLALSYQLYSRYNIENFGFLDQLNLTGFIVKELSQDNLPANFLELNGNKYVKYQVKRLILTPTGTGSYTIPASTFQVNVSTGNFFDSSQAVYLETEPVELEVKALPLNKQPENFKGLVGKLELESTYSKQEVEYGDSLTLTVKLSGNCNLDSLDKILENEIPGVTIYQTEKAPVEEIKNGQYFASKEFEIIIVPEQIRDIKIPAIEIPYFNPAIEEYETARIEETKIKVIGQAEVFSQRTEINDTTEPRESIRIEQVNYTLANNDYLLIQIKKSHLKTALYILVVLALLTLFICFFYKYSRRDDRLKQILKKIKKENDEKEIYKLLNEMIKYKYNLSLKAVSKEKLKSKIEDKEILHDVLDIIDYLENKEYGKDITSINLKDRIKKIYKQMA